MSGPLEIGDRIADNDPRTCARKLVVIAIVGDHAKVQNELNGRVYRIQIKRIFTDGNPRRHGFNRVDGAK